MTREDGLIHGFWNEHFYSTAGDYEAERAFGHLSALVASDDAYVVAANESGRPVGVLALVAHRTMWGTTRVAAEILWYVHPDYRGQGHGRKLMQMGKRWAESANCHLIQAHAGDRQIFVRVN
ncbi:MAG: GNAT family N-acetyltransferase [Bacteroidetes bacterium]|nr:GNAT family N-acetyltransferase [Bacteroidota bacterium]